ncbi:hypothetical protein Tco_0416151, partial [Tanacetum coccineum]
VRRTRGWQTGEEPELFGDDVLLRPTDIERKSNLQTHRVRVKLINVQTRNKDGKMIAVNTEGIDPIDKAVIEEAKREIRAKYYPQN